MNFKKFFYSFDLQGNKIKNVKVDLPVNPTDITNKEYVDKNFIYDTEKSVLNSLKFTWMVNLTNKSLKELFDLLLFPTINPTYTNPFLSNISIDAPEEFIIYRGKKAIFKNRRNKFKLNYYLNLGDRHRLDLSKIIITNLDGTITEILGDIYSDVKGFEFEFDFTNILSIIWTKTLTAATPKVNNYGVESIPVDFTTTYDLTFDILSFINKNFKVYNPILYQTLNSYSEIDGYLNFDAIENAPFVKDREFYSSNTANNKILFGIPIELTKGFFYMYIDDGSIIQMDFSMFDNVTYQVVTYYADEITYNYFFGTLDLGAFTTNKQIKLGFNLVK